MKCALYERTPKAVAARVEKIFDSIKRHPIPAVTGDGGPGDYGIVGYTQVRRLAFDFLYLPFGIGGQNLARVLAALEKGDGVPFYTVQGGNRNVQCESDEKVRRSSVGFSQLMTVALGCSDGDQVKDTVPQLEKWYEANKKLSSFADQWPWRISCAYVILSSGVTVSYSAKQRLEDPTS
jgi:hypothetical protein